MHLSAAHALAFARLIPCAYSYLARRLTRSRRSSSWRLVDSVLLISNSYATSIVAEVIDATIDIVVDHLTRLQECLLYVEACLGRCLEEDETVLLGEALALFRAHLTSAIEISLVSYEHEHDVRVAILSDFFEPTGQMIESLLPCYIIH